ncbi:serine/threonine-protein phosphatase 7 long form isoform X1 [Cinnamomum micranthum f. kanehirae]|uniref:Serine/threonine-protein phosphatase 7 long form isoform X1 n=1 Tax=Cinnamomum micranthum f. kanehirae TaxID=337451 RepID=A0A3S3QD82_9MAGN|nr:serine/threonine-protein phosphatase 7 long form isoform X1 [Cinnamomum micranthum f. kanehirae]
MTITLDDVATILQIPIIGQSVSYNAISTVADAQSLLVFALGVKLEEAHDELVLAQGQSVRMEWLRSRISNVSDAHPEEMIMCAARAYFLYLLGCTLFTNKSALGLASRYGVRQIAGYLTLLEAWVYELFEDIMSNLNLQYSESQPRAHHWIPRRESGEAMSTLQALREKIDMMGTNRITWDPYNRIRHHHRFHEVAFYSGYIKCMDVVEPYHPDRVFRQFGRIQSIPPAPLAPIRVTQGPTATQYHIAYGYLD